MSRGGRGGGRGGRGGGAGGQQHLIDLDQDFMDQLHKFDEDQKKIDAEADRQHSRDERQTFLWPAYPGGVPIAPPLDEDERKLIQLGRERRTWIRNSVFWTGDPDETDYMKRNKRDAMAADFDAFNDVDTYAKKYKRPKFRLRDLRQHKFANPAISHPHELWASIGFNPDTWEADRQTKKPLFAKRPKRDPLAKFDDDADENAGAKDDEAGDDEEDGAAVEEEDEEADAPVQDDAFEDEDSDDDYNAEKMFDNGEEDYEELAGEEMGGGGDEY